MNNNLNKLIFSFFKYLIPERDRNLLYADFEYLYKDILLKKGKLYARFWFIGQILRSLPGLILANFLWKYTMFKKYLIIAFRSQIRRRVISAINIAGLAIGTAASIIIMQYIGFETSFDKFHKNSQNIYRIQYNYYKNGVKKSEKAVSVPAIGPVLKNIFPEVAEYARATRAFLENSAISYKGKTFRENRILQVTPSFLKMMTFPLLEGDSETALLAPFKTIITQSTAKRYFGEENPLGKVIKWNGIYGENEFEITGVCQDVPQNSHLKFDFLFSYKTLGQIAPIENASERSESDWDWNYFYTYISLKPGISAKNFQQKINENLEKIRGDLWKKQIFYQKFLLQPLEDIHLYSHLAEETQPDEQGNGDAINYLILIAFFILILAWVNYINISISQAIERAKEVGVRKITGAIRGELIKQFLVEYIGINILSVGLAILLVEMSKPFFSYLTGVDLFYHFLFESKFCYIFLGIFLVGTFLSGFYPALILSAYNPVVVLKGVFMKSVKGIKLRKILITSQLTISIVLITCTIIIFQQVSFMLNKDLKIDLKQTLVLRGPGTTGPDSIFTRNVKAFCDEMKQQPGISGFTTASNVPGEEIYIASGIRKSEDHSSKTTGVKVVVIDYDYIPTFNIKLLAGRNFSPTFTTDKNAVILNEAAVKMLGYKNPQVAQNREIIYRRANKKIIGVLENYHQMSLKTIVFPIIFILRENRTEFFAMKIRPDSTSSLDISQSKMLLKQKWEHYFPGNPFDYFFLDDFFNRQYLTEQKFSKIFALFAILIIFIACLGLFALASLNTSQRTKEIGIRKAVGAPTFSIFVLLSKEFLKLFLLATILAIPFTFVSMKKWLENFAFHIRIEWWHFIASSVIVVVVVWLVISYRIFKAAKANPVDGLRYE